MKVFQVVFAGRVRLETLNVVEAERYATDLYNDEKANPNRIIPDIFESEAEPISHVSSTR